MKSILGDRDFRQWLALVGSMTIVLMSAYVMVQQSTRASANDMPRNTALSAKRALESGSSASDTVPAYKVDLRDDTNVFITITDNSYNIAASSANLDGKPPLPPAGVFEAAKKNGFNSISYQPAPDVRQAIYVIPYGQGPDGYIVAGQSLKPTEDRVSTYNILFVAGWVISVAWASLLLLPRNKK